MKSGHPYRTSGRSTISRSDSGCLTSHFSIHSAREKNSMRWLLGFLKNWRVSSHFFLNSGNSVFSGTGDIARLQSVLMAVVPDCNDVVRFSGRFVPHVSVGQTEGVKSANDLMMQTIWVTFGTLGRKMGDYVQLFSMRSPSASFKVFHMQIILRYAPPCFASSAQWQVRIGLHWNPHVYCRRSVIPLHDQTRRKPTVREPARTAHLHYSCLHPERLHRGPQC